MEHIDVLKQTEEDRILILLLEAFPGIALESLASAYARASGDPNKAAEILSSEKAKKSRESLSRRHSLVDDFGRFGSTFETIPKPVHSSEYRRVDDTQQCKNGHGEVSSSGRGNFSNSEMEPAGRLYSGRFRKKKMFVEGEVEESEDVTKQRAAEDFLHSMLGGDIGIDVVRDVLGHFAGDTNQALETLLHIGSTSSGYNYSTEVKKNFEMDIEPLATNIVHHEGVHLKTENSAVMERSFDEDPLNNETKNRAIIERSFDEELMNKNVLMRLKETFPTVELSFLSEVLEAADFSYEEAVMILTESGMIPVGRQVQPKLDAREVLHALFRTNLEPEESGTSDGSVTPTEPWRVVAAKPKVLQNPADPERCYSKADGEWNEYASQRLSATEHWATMKKYMKEAAVAYSQGNRALAGVLSEKGARFKAMAQEASDRASQNIFNVKNKDIENNITIDLHAQHVTEALELLKLHLRCLSQIPSVRLLTVITGQGSHSAGGRARIKPVLTQYLNKKKIRWKEQNAGCVLINLADTRAPDPSRQKSSGSSSENESY